MDKKILFSLFITVLIYSCSKTSEEIDISPTIDPTISNCINLVQIASIPKQINEPTAFTLKGKGYIGLGVNVSPPTYSKEFWRYDEVANSWERIPDFPIEVRSAMSFVIGDTAYVGGGIYIEKRGDLTIAKVSKKLYAYHENSSRWIEKDSLPIGCVYSAAFSDKENGYFIGGVISDETGKLDLNFRYDNRVYKYAPANNKWEIANDFVKPVKHAAGISSENARHFVFGGLIDTFSVIHEYMPNDTWRLEEVTCFNDSMQVSEFISFYENNNIYFGLGSQRKRNSLLPNSLWRYNIETNTCEELCVRKGSDVDVNFRLGVSFSTENNHYIGLGVSEGRAMYKVEL